MYSKRGLSPVIATVLLIAVSFLVILVFWFSINSLIQNESKKISSGLIEISLEVKSIQLQNNGDLLVRVKRNSGAGDLSGISFVVSDGSNSIVFEINTNLKELEERAFIIPKEKIISLASVKSVSVAPIINFDSNKNVQKDIVNTRQVELSNTVNLAGDNSTVEIRKLIVID
jgi:flagellin-like protein